MPGPKTKISTENWTIFSDKIGPTLKFRSPSLKSPVNFSLAMHRVDVKPVYHMVPYIMYGGVSDMKVLRILLGIVTLDIGLSWLCAFFLASSGRCNIQFHQNVLTWAESLGPTCDLHMTTLATTS